MSPKSSTARRSLLAGLAVLSVVGAGLGQAIAATPPTTPQPTTTPAPTTPVSPTTRAATVSGLTSTTATVAWPALIRTDFSYVTVLTSDGGSISNTRDPSASPSETYTGLHPDTAYSFTVYTYERLAIPTSPRPIQTPWATVQFRTPPLPGTTPAPETTPPMTTPEQPTTPQPCDCDPIRLDLTGSATLKTLARGTVPLSGGLAVSSADVATGAFTADLTLNPTQAKLVAFGFLPVVAKVQLVSTRPVTGSLKGGALTANAVVRIKLPSLTLLGLPLAGGATCQTKQPSNVPLTSSGGSFTPLGGGRLAGTFAISDLTGCGAFTGLVSSATAGKGNAIAVQLAPRP